jgi:nitrogen-specific signal transduction histidine kinase
MKKNKVESKKMQNNVLHYLRALTDTAREPILILSSDLTVLAANPFFYETFKVSPEQTNKRFIYDLGNGQWNLVELKILLENILPKKKIIKDFNVTHTFPKIGKKTMQLNARQIDAMQMIVLAFEDITTKKKLEEKATRYTKDLEERVVQRTQDLGEHIQELKKLTRAFVGRELRIVELKKIVAELERRVKSINHISVK